MRGETMMTSNEQTKTTETLYVMTSPTGSAYLAQDANETGRYRWLDADGNDTETSGATIPEAIAAAEAGWPEGTVKGYQLRRHEADDDDRDLWSEVALADWYRTETYRIYPVDGAYVREGAETGRMLYDTTDHRAGIAWGSDADWTDAESPAEALRLWATDRLVN